MGQDMARSLDSQREAAGSFSMRFLVQWEVLEIVQFMSTMVLLATGRDIGNVLVSG